jgi:tousled-like kinase
VDEKRGTKRAAAATGRGGGDARKKSTGSKKRQTSLLESPSAPNADAFYARPPTTPSREQALAEQLSQAEKEKGQLEKSQRASEQTIQELKRRLRAKEEEMTNRQGAQKSDLDRAYEDIDRLKTKVKSTEHSQKQQEDRAAAALVEVIRKAALLEKDECRRTLAADKYKYGRVAMQRLGTKFSEYWEDGALLQEVKNKIASVGKRRETAEKRKKSVLTKCKAARKVVGQKNQDNSGWKSGKSMAPPSANMTPLEIALAEEMVVVEVQSLKAEEAQLTDELARVEASTAKHMRELKRIKDEDNSRFRHRPVLQKRWLLIELLGKGGFSEVWKCFDLKNYRYAAVKIHQLNPGWSEAKRVNYVKHATREFQIHRKLDCPYIVKQFDVFGIEEESFATVLEWCDSPDLDYRLKTERCLLEKEARAILLQILSGLRYLNVGIAGNKVIHYDLKPGNILFKDGYAKITDFGLSKLMDEQDDATSMELTSQGAGTYWYLPPECFQTGHGVPKISSKVDVWSVGVMYYQMIYGKRPFGEGQTQESILNDRTILNAREVTFPEKFKNKVSNEAKEFIQLCLTYDQKYRPDIVNLCKTKYVGLGVKIK